MAASISDYLELYPEGEETLPRLLEQRTANDPDRVFLLQGERQWTYDELNRAANRMARGLQRAGVKPGDPVVAMMVGSYEQFVAWFAIAKAGAIEVPINHAYKGQMLAYILTTANARLAIVDAAFAKQVAEVRSQVPVLERVLINGSHDGSGDGTLRDLDVGPGIGNDANLDLPIRSRDPSCVIFTSGTTGPSKGVVLTHSHQISFAIFFAETVSMNEADVAYNYLPFFHIAAKFLCIGPMLTNARMAVEPVFSLSRFWADVRHYKATLCVAVGGLCYMLRRPAPKPDDADNTLRAIYSVPVPVEFQAEFEKRFGLILLEGYGSTETNIVAHSMHGRTPAGSCGRASRHFEVVIQDEEGRLLPPSESGEICVRGRRPNTQMSHYLGLPEKTLETMRDQWVHTGDRGYIDAEGFLYFQDRLKDSIRRRGENISSFEVERLINNHPAVAESAVVAVPSEVGEDDVKAVVVLKAGQRLGPLDLLRFCAETMPYFMAPRYIAFRDALPRTPTQKVQKVELRREGIAADLWDREAEGWTVGRDGLRRRQFETTG